MYLTETRSNERGRNSLAPRWIKRNGYEPS